MWELWYTLAHQGIQYMHPNLWERFSNSAEEQGWYLLDCYTIHHFSHDGLQLHIFNSIKKKKQGKKIELLNRNRFKVYVPWKYA